MEIQLEQYTKLIEDHAKVTYYKIRKPPQCSLNDLIQEGVVVFLIVRKDYSDQKKVSFKTYFTLRLRQHLNGIVKKSYRHPKDSLDWREKSERKSKVSVDPAEAVYIHSLLEKLTADELEYVKTILLLHGEKRFARRRIARGILGISYGREVKLRNSINSKVKK